MRFIWHRDQGILELHDSKIFVQCHVRNELNGERQLNEKAVFTERKNGSEGLPYMPRPFPLGLWNVQKPLPKTNPYEAPFFIPTDAHQQVEFWLINTDGSYNKPSGQQIEDYGYGLHCSTSQTTLGCGRVINRSDLENLLKIIASESCQLEVV